MDSETKKEFGNVYIELSKDNNTSLVRELEKFYSFFLYIIGGTIALSVTFLTDFFQKYRLTSPKLFIWSLCLLTGSLYFYAFSFFTAKKHFINRGKRITLWYKESLNKRQIQNFDEADKWTRFTNILNIIAVALGFFGFTLFVIFGISVVLKITSVNPFNT